ncbi:MAG: metal ABC transporter substrate-binding protein [Verrucomicrobiae bacterium]|nr:metal ABC transporter substrate-binding protein [Verrucomicrobiae bacterium]
MISTIRKTRATWLIAAMLLASAAHAKLNVVTTTPDLAAMTKAIGGNEIAVTCIGKPSEDPHYIQAKPSFIVALNRADVLIVVGMELEVGWLPALQKQTRNARVQTGGTGYVDASEGVPALDVPTAPVTRAQGDVHPLGNPHYLLDPEAGKIAARNIAAGLKRAAPDKAAEFDRGLAKLLADIDAAMHDAQQRLAPFRGARLITYHRSFTYFAARYGLNVVAQIEPKPGIPPSPAHLVAVAELMKREGAKLILQEPWHERRTAELLAQQTGAKVLVVPVQTGADPAAPDYPSAIKWIAEKVAEALK